MAKFLSRLYKAVLPGGQALITFDAYAAELAMPFDVTGPAPVQVPSAPMTDREADAWMDAHMEPPWVLGFPGCRPLDLPPVEQLEALEEVLTQSSIRWDLAWGEEDGDRALVVTVENRSPHVITRLGCCFAYDCETPQPPTIAAGVPMRQLGAAHYCFQPEQATAEANQVCRFRANGRSVDAMRRHTAALSVERYRIRITTADEPFAEIPGPIVGAFLET